MSQHYLLKLSLLSLQQIAHRIGDMQPLVAAQDRQKAVRYGIRINLVARSTESEARNTVVLQKLFEDRKIL